LQSQNHFCTITITAWTLLAECGDVTRFATVEALVAYAGLDPKQHQPLPADVRGAFHVTWTAQGELIFHIRDSADANPPRLLKR
jgi:transposase